MNCTEWEETTALAVSGDLPEAKLARVEAHLRGCAACRSLAEELRADRRILSELRDESLDAAALDEVRRRVLAGISQPARRRGLAWVYAAAAACLVLAAGVALVWRMPETGRPATPEAARRPEPTRIEAAQVPPRAARAPARRRPVAKVRPRQVIAEPARPEAVPAGASEPDRQLVVKLLTDDPDVVIYLLVSENGG